MAKVNFGEMIADIRGKLGGNVYSRNPYGSYIRMKVTPVNPQSQRQVLIRDRFTEVSQLWKSLTDKQRLAWSHFQMRFKIKKVFGIPSNYTAYNTFVSLNTNLKTVLLDPILDPPLIKKARKLDTISFIAQNDPQLFQVSFAPNNDENNRYLISATPAVSPGFTFPHHLWRTIGILTETQTSPVNLTNNYSNIFGTIEPVGDRIFCKIVAINSESGMRGVPIYNTSKIQ